MVFSKSDLYFYYAFCCFSLEEYEEALEKFEKSMESKYSEENSYFEQVEEEALRGIFEGDETEERGPITGQTFTKIEMLYNLAMVNLMLNRKKDY